MFAKLFVPKSKSLRRTDTELTQSTYTQLLTAVDAAIHSNYNHLIIISSPYCIPHCTNSIQNALNIHHLSYITPIITSLLFFDHLKVYQQMAFVTTLNEEALRQFMDKMSIIIIDLSSSQYIAIPTNVSDLIPSNNIINVSNTFYTQWQITWNTQTSKVSAHFNQIMNDICKVITEQYGTFFSVTNHSSHPNRQNAPNLNDSIQSIRSAVSMLERREVFLDNKIATELKNAKAKCKISDKNGAMRHLRKKKNLENQLKIIQVKKLNLETQIMALEDQPLNGPLITSPQVQTTDIEDDFENQNLTMPQMKIVDISAISDSEERELAELDLMTQDH